MFPLAYFWFDFQKLAVRDQGKTKLIFKRICSKTAHMDFSSEQFAFLLYCRTGLCDHIIGTNKQTNKIWPCSRDAFK